MSSVSQQQQQQQQQQLTHTHTQTHTHTHTHARTHAHTHTHAHFEAINGLKGEGVVSLCLCVYGHNYIYINRRVFEGVFLKQRWSLVSEAGNSPNVSLA